MSASAEPHLINFDNSYASMAPEFYARLEPTPVSNPALIAVNDALALQLGIDPAGLRGGTGLQVLAGNAVASGSEPLAMAYAGHQFGNWVPQLGDGRALLLGEVIGSDGVRYDLQLKGAGRTPYSRGGDGRNWVGPVLREYLLSEAMAALGVPTTRALAAVTTGDFVLREQGPLPGAILTRVARSHIRVGTFQYFAARQNLAAIEALMLHVIDRHYPQVAEADNPGLALLHAVVQAQAKLIAHWQSIGFIHGVMNTDNSSVSGDTIDYGPCAFMDTYAADKVFSSIDRGARYAYQNQPRIAQWNLANLAQCLLPFIDDDQDKAVALAQTAINDFDAHYIAAYLTHMRAKLGLSDEQEGDLELSRDLLAAMELHELDFTLTFRQLALQNRKGTVPHTVGSNPFAQDGPLHQWRKRWEQRLHQAPGLEADKYLLMQASNPAIIPRNHQVEAVISAAVARSDFEPFHALLAAVTTPFDERHDNSVYAHPPVDDEIVTQTFCGT